MDAKEQQSEYTSVRTDLQTIRFIPLPTKSEKVHVPVENFFARKNKVSPKSNEDVV